MAVTVSGGYAFVTDAFQDLQVIDISNPSNCVRVCSYATRGHASAVAVAGDRIYVADGGGGLLVLPSLPNFQFTVRVDATPNAPFTLESTTSPWNLVSWQPLLTTNVTTMPFDFVDLDVKLSEKPRKFYRVRQP
jgi:hypothetical protein